MESDKTYRDSLTTINKLLKYNCNTEMSIDYNKLDNQTAGELRKAIDSVLIKRRREVELIIISKPNN